MIIAIRVIVFLIGFISETRRKSSLRIASGLRRALPQSAVIVLPPFGCKRVYMRLKVGEQGCFLLGVVE